MSSSQPNSDGLKMPFLYDDSDTHLSDRNTNNFQMTNNSTSFSTIASRHNQNGKSSITNHNHESSVTSTAAGGEGGTTAVTPSPSTAASNEARSVAVFMKLKTYLLALRPWSLSASLVPTLLGSALAYRSSTPHGFNFLTFILTVFTVVMVHGAGNVVNTYYDYVKGIDNRKSEDRTLVDHILSTDEVVSLGALIYIAALIGFSLLSIISPAKPEHLAFVFFGGLSSSFLYTGGIGLKYIALGDILVLIIFGPISVLFAYFAQTGTLIWSTIYFAIPLALNTEAILHSNNTRDAKNDAAAGIVTLAIIIGRSASHVLYAILLFTPYIIFVVLTLKYSTWFVLPLVTLPQAFKIEKLFRSETTLHCVPRQTAKLNFFFGILYVIACCGATQLPGLSITPH